MPFPSLCCFAFCTGLLASLAGRAEVLTAGDRWWASETFSVFAVFMGLVLVPVTSYFYAFHGDWFLLYLASTGSVISSLGLFIVGLVLSSAVGGFALGSKLCRLEQTGQLWMIAAGAIGAAFFFFLIAWPRATVVGSKVQFAKDFGLNPYWGSAAAWSGLWMTLVGAAALGSLWFTLRRRYHED